MTQADVKLTQTGVESGSTSTCQYCGGMLTVQEGTDPDEARERGGFRETYECIRCNRAGTYTFRYEDSHETFGGACADYDNDL